MASKEKIRIKKIIKRKLSNINKLSKVPHGKKLLEVELQLIDGFYKEIQGLKSLKKGRLYKFPDYNDYDSPDPVESYGYIEFFNLDSFRVKIVASATDIYSDKYRLENQRYRNNITTVNYDRYEQLLHAKRTDLPLMMVLAYRSADFEKILSGKKRLKLD